MARPIERGSTWSRLQVASAAGVSEATARKCEAAGLLAGPYHHIDVFRLQVAAACLASPDPLTPSKGLSERNRLAMRFAMANLGDPASHIEASVILAGSMAYAADSHRELLTLLDRLPAVPVSVLPVGRWVAAHVLRTRQG